MAIRVLVVEDSVTVRNRLVEVLSADPQLQVVGEAEDGKTAIELCLKLRPDVVTVDMLLPVLSGLAVTEYIMAYCPTPILIVSSSTNRGDVFKTYDALAAGALEVLEKPNGEIEGVWERKLLSTVKLVSKIRVITHMRGKIQPAPAPTVPLEPGPYRVVALGGSTGGPAAAAEILRNIPATFPLPILMVLHLGDAFGRTLAEWLDSQSGLRVNCAVEGEQLPEIGHARVILAPPGCHMLLSGNQVRLTHQPERHSCRPSVDVLFESVAREVGPRAIGGLLTGMGRDGAQGLLAIRQSGGLTLAQDEATSIIFGMPKEAIRLGAAGKVLGLQEFAPALAALAGVGRGERAASGG
jgi:two-component system chemotaxis response regulator CheB